MRRLGLATEQDVVAVRRAGVGRGDQRFATCGSTALVSPCDGTGRGEDRAGARIISGHLGQHSRRVKRQRGEGGCGGGTISTV